MPTLNLVVCQRQVPSQVLVMRPLGWFSGRLLEPVSNSLMHQIERLCVIPISNHHANIGVLKVEAEDRRGLGQFAILVLQRIKNWLDDLYEITSAIS